MKSTHVIGLFVVALGACERKSSPPASTPAPEPAPPAASTPPSVPVLTLAAGEKLAPAPMGTVNQVVWDTPAGKVLLASVARPDGVVLRAYTLDASVEITAPLAIGESGHCWVKLRGDVLFRCEPDAGVLEEHHGQRIVWDATTRAPVVADTWSCKDEDFDRRCEFPVWATDPLPPDPDRPSVDEAVDAVRAWLGAVHENDTKTAAAMMTADVSVAIDYYPLGDEEAGCPTGAATQQAAAAAGCAHAILATAARMQGNLTRDDASLEAPDGWQRAPHEIYVSVEGNGEEWNSLTAALVKDHGVATIRAVWLDRSIADE